MSNELRTQGTEVWVCDAAASIKKVGNLIDIGEFGKNAGDIDSTNLDSTARERLAGLPDNGDLTLQINVDPLSAAHKYLSSTAGTAARREFLVGFSDGTAAPTVAVGTEVITAPTGRSSQKFLGVVKSYRFGVGGVDGLLKATVTVGISGAITETWKA
jgi:hypothetical protein